MVINFGSKNEVRHYVIAVPKLAFKRHNTDPLSADQITELCRKTKHHN